MKAPAGLLIVLSAHTDFIECEMRLTRLPCSSSPTTGGWGAPPHHPPAPSSGFTRGGDGGRGRATSSRERGSRSGAASPTSAASSRPTSAPTSSRYPGDGGSMSKAGGGWRFDPTEYVRQRREALDARRAGGERGRSTGLVGWLVGWLVCNGVVHYLFRLT